MKRAVLTILLMLTSATLMIAQLRREKMTETDGFVWYLVQDESNPAILGAEDENGKTLVPLNKGITSIGYAAGYAANSSLGGVFRVFANGSCGVYGKDGGELIPIGRYDNVFLLSGWFCVKHGDKEGACDLSGKEIISPDRGYDSIFFSDGTYYKVKHGDKEGACDLSGKELISPDRGYDNIYRFSKETYYRVERNGKGICDLSGSELISPDRGYESITLMGERFFVKNGGKEGVCDLSGKELISPDRGYDSIFLRDGTYYSVKRGGKEGVCDLSGKEIYPPLYDDLIYMDGEFRARGADDHWHPIGALNAKTGQASSSGAENLLYSGQYTYTGLIRTSDDFIGTGEPGLCNIRVYVDELYFNSDPPARYIGDKTVYDERGRAYGESDKYYLVTGSGDIRYVVNVPVYIPMVGTFNDARMAFFDKGDTVSQYQGRKFSSKSNMNNNYNSGSNYGGGTYDSGSTTTNQSRSSCPVCYGTGNCQTCYGRGWVNNPYTNDSHSCTTCNPNGNSPTKGKCYKCHGTGKI